MRAVADNGNHRIAVHSANDGSFERVLCGGAGAFALTQPRDCAVVRDPDAAGRGRWLCTTEATRVMVLALDSGSPVQVVPVPGARSLWGVTVLPVPPQKGGGRQLAVVDADGPTLRFLRVCSSCQHF